MSAGNNPSIAANLTPYFGRLTISDVLDPVGNSLAASYLLDCGYRLALIPGKDEKAGLLQGHPLFGEIDTYLDSLSAIGIRHPYDCSVFIPGLANGFTVIDVASWDAMAELSLRFRMWGGCRIMLGPNEGSPPTA